MHIHEQANHCIDLAGVNAAEDFTSIDQLDSHSPKKAILNIIGIVLISGIEFLDSAYRGLQ